MVQLNVTMDGQAKTVMKCYVKVIAIIMVFAKKALASVRQINGWVKHVTSKYVLTAAQVMANVKIMENVLVKLVLQEMIALNHIVIITAIKMDIVLVAHVNVQKDFRELTALKKLVFKIAPVTENVLMEFAIVSQALQA